MDLLRTSTRVYILAPIPSQIPLFVLTGRRPSFCWFKRGHYLRCLRQREPGLELLVCITSNLMAKERKGKRRSGMGESPLIKYTSSPVRDSFPTRVILQLI